MQRFLPNEAAHVVFGEALGHALNGHGQVHLEGELGAGKTTLTRGILQAYGHEGAVKSPTYTLVEPYMLDGRCLYHFDLYRLGDPEELEFMGARDMLGEDALSLIEWPSRGDGWLPPPDLVICLALFGEGRQVTLEGLSPHGQAVISALCATRQDKEADA